MEKKSPTLQDIADRAGVSKNTVSRALRSHPKIPEVTRKRIRKIASELGYRPNPMVSALMQSLRQAHPIAQTANLAYFTLNPVERRFDYISKLYAGAKARAEELGYNLVEVWPGEPGMTGQRLGKILDTMGIQGVVISPNVEHQPLADFPWHQFACAAIGHSLPKPDLHRVAGYYMHALPKALLKLQDLGYRKAGIEFSHQTGERFDHAFEASVAMARNIPEIKIGFNVLQSSEITAKSLDAWIRKNKIDVLISTGTDGFRKAMNELGLRSPEDIGLVMMLKMHSRHNEAYLRSDLGGISKAAVDLVVSQLMYNERGIPEAPHTILLELEWNQGKTILQQNPAR